MPNAHVERSSDSHTEEGFLAGLTAAMPNREQSKSPYPTHPIPTGRAIMGGSQILSCDSRLTPSGQYTADLTERDETAERVIPSSNTSDVEETPATELYSNRGSSSWQTFRNDMTDSQGLPLLQDHREQRRSVPTFGATNRSEHDDELADGPRGSSGTHHTTVTSEAAIDFSNSGTSSSSHADGDEGDEGAVDKGRHMMAEDMPATQPRRRLPSAEQAKASVIRRLIAEYHQAREERLRHSRGGGTSFYNSGDIPAAPREDMSVLNRYAAVNSGVFASHSATFAGRATQSPIAHFPVNGAREATTAFSRGESDSMDEHAQEEAAGALVTVAAGSVVPPAAHHDPQPVHASLSSSPSSRSPTLLRGPPVSPRGAANRRRTAADCATGEDVAAAAVDQRPPCPGSNRRRTAPSNMGEETALFDVSQPPSSRPMSTPGEDCLFTDPTDAARFARMGSNASSNLAGSGRSGQRAHLPPMKPTELRGHHPQRKLSISATPLVVTKEPKIAHTPAKTTATGSARFRRERSGQTSVSNLSGLLSVSEGHHLDAAGTNGIPKGTSPPPPALFQRNPAAPPTKPTTQPASAGTPPLAPTAAAASNSARALGHSHDERDGGLQVVRKAFPFLRSASASGALAASPDSSLQHLPRDGKARGTAACEGAKTGTAAVAEKQSALSSLDVPHLPPPVPREQRPTPSSPSPPAAMSHEEAEGGSARSGTPQSSAKTCPPESVHGAAAFPVKQTPVLVDKKQRDAPTAAKPIPALKRRPTASPAKTTPSPSPSPPPPATTAAHSAAPPEPRAKQALPRQPAVSPVKAPAWTPPPQRTETRPTDEPDVLVPAIKYSYDVRRCHWSTTHFMVRVLHPNRGLSQGGMRVAFEVEELDDTGFGSAMVAKMFRHNITDVVEEDYLNECEAQSMCEEFADSFNKVAVEGVTKANISFLQCSVVKIPKEDVPDAYKSARKGFFSYRTTDTRDILFNMEPKLTGNFTKYTSNFGDVYETNERYIPPAQHWERKRILDAVEAFSHFTLVESGGSMLVCDLQGVNDFLTDPQIHTEDGKGLGMGNMGQEGIDKWVEKHKCKELCHAMDLQPLTGGAKGLTDKRRGSYFRRLVDHVQGEEPVQPQDLIPLPKPLEEMTDEERFEYAVRLSEMMDA